jgi:hypothetical protein
MPAEMTARHDNGTVMGRMYETRMMNTGIVNARIVKPGMVRA